MFDEWTAFNWSWIEYRVLMPNIFITTGLRDDHCSVKYQGARLFPGGFQNSRFSTSDIARFVFPAQTSLSCILCHLHFEISNSTWTRQNSWSSVDPSHVSLQNIMATTSHPCLPVFPVSACPSHPWHCPLPHPAYQVTPVRSVIPLSKLCPHASSPLNRRPLEHSHCPGARQSHLQRSLSASYLAIPALFSTLQLGQVFWNSKLGHVTTVPRFPTKNLLMTSHCS